MAEVGSCARRSFSEGWFDALPAVASAKAGSMFIFIPHFRPKHPQTIHSRKIVRVETMGFLQFNSALPKVPSHKIEHS